MNSDRILFTGGTGFIGKRLALKLAAQKSDLVFIVIKSEIEKAKALVESLREDYPEGTFEYLVGDISKPNLGLTSEQYKQCEETITGCFHLAAIYDLAVSKALAEKVNVTGTKQVIEFCKTSKHNPYLLYYSTCYVSGLLKGTFKETDLDGSAGFKNFYEQTKFEAEVKVRQAMKEGLKAIIIRPAIVVGDSRTGETDKFDGLYFSFRLVTKLKFLPIRMPQPGALDAKLPMVPVDYLVNSTLAAVADLPNSAGKTFQVSDPNAMMAKDVFHLICKKVTGRPPGFQIPAWMLRLPLKFKPIRMWFGVPVQILDFFEHPICYETTNTTALVTKQGIRCPKFSEYFPTLYSFWKEKSQT